jgi:hypothetical protein
MGVRSEHRLRLLRVDHRRDLRRLVAWIKASSKNLSHRCAVIVLGRFNTVGDAAQPCPLTKTRGLRQSVRQKC